MTKKIILFSFLFGLLNTAYSQENEINISELRQKAISYTQKAIKSYDDFYSTKDKSNLIDGIKYASKASELFDIYIRIEDVPEDSDLIYTTKGISRSSNQYANELINVSLIPLRLTVIKSELIMIT